MVFSVAEVFDMIVMVLAVGFIFKDFFRAPAHEDPIERFKKRDRWANFKFAIYVTAPAIILHEFGHKFVAMAYGLQATFHAAYLWLGVGVVLKLVSAPFLFFVPAYVSISGSAAPLHIAIIAFAGPAVNLMLWIGSLLILKSKTKLTKKQIMILHLTKQINMFLFIFNMIPIGFFDGAKVLSGLLAAFA